jgi:hypothetical protein
MSTKRIYTRNRARNAVVFRDDTVIDTFIDTLLRQQQAILDRSEVQEAKALYVNTNPDHDCIGVPREVLATSREEADAIIEVRWALGNKYLR